MRGKVEQYTYLRLLAMNPVYWGGSKDLSSGKPSDCLTLSTNHGSEKLENL